MASINVTIEAKESEVTTGTLAPQKAAKRKRRVMILEKKMDIPDLRLQGKPNSFVCCLNGINESTISTIKKCKTLIIVSCTLISLKRCFIPHDLRMEKIEMMLNI